MNANTKKMNRLTLAAAALLFTTVPLAAPSAQAITAVKTITVAMTYDRDAPADRIYSSLRRQARLACAPGVPAHQVLNWSERRCVTQLVSKAVVKIDRPALAAYYASTQNPGA
jgi:UrcA family protein